MILLVFVTPTGIEPVTYALEERCSIQLSYGACFLVFGYTLLEIGLVIG